MTPLEKLFSYANEKHPGEREVREVLASLPRISLNKRTRVPLYGNPSCELYLLMTSCGATLELNNADECIKPWTPSDHATSWQVYVTLPSLLAQFQIELRAEIEQSQTSLAAMQQAQDAFLKL